MDNNDQLTRQERRELRRTEQKQQQASSGKRRFVRRLILWTGSIAILAGIGWGMTRLAANVPLPTDEGTLAVPVTDTDLSIGPASASVTLVEYADFQCPACAAFYPVVKQLLQEPDLTGKIRYVFRHFPLKNIHKNAELASRAAQAASIQGKFWEMHDKLFDEQRSWQGLSTQGARDAFMEYARVLEINTEWFAGDLDSAEVAEKVEGDLEGGLRSGVNSTPTFFLNGTRMPQLTSYEEFKQLVTSHVTTP
jgi:protein-disulfide isomerase